MDLKLCEVGGKWHCSHFPEKGVLANHFISPLHHSRQQVGTGMGGWVESCLHRSSLQEAWPDAPHGACEALEGATALRWEEFY